MLTFYNYFPFGIIKIRGKLDDAKNGKEIIIMRAIVIIIKKKFFSGKIGVVKENPDL